MKKLGFGVIRCGFQAAPGLDICRWHAGENVEKADLAMTRKARYIQTRRAFGGIGRQIQFAWLRQLKNNRERIIYREAMGAILTDNPELMDNFADMTQVHNLCIAFVKLTLKDDVTSVEYDKFLRRCSDIQKQLGVRRDFRLRTRAETEKAETIADAFAKLVSEAENGGAVRISEAKTMRKAAAGLAPKTISVAAVESPDLDGEDTQLPEGFEDAMEDGDGES